MTASHPRIALIGAGIIGLSCAWELSRRGARVSVYEMNWPPRGASWAAAGMLAPAYEAAAEAGAHPRLFDLCMESAALWPDFAADLGAASGTNIGYARDPSMALARDEKDDARLETLACAIEARGVSCERLAPDAARRIEPALSQDIWAGLLMPTDGQVDNRSVMNALAETVERSPLIDIHVSAPPLFVRNGRLTIEAHDVILASAGWRTGRIEVETEGGRALLAEWDEALGAVTAFGGQMLSVACGPETPKTTLRKGPVYIAPKSDRVVIGATVEPGVVIRTTDPAAIKALKAEAAGLAPSLAEAQVLETWAGVRPGAPDHAPLLGRTAAPGLYVAAGHYRNGILLAPITAKLMADMILEERVPPLAAAFAPSRFAPAAA